MPSIEVDVEIEVYCEKCGAGLCGQTTAVRTHRRGLPAFRVQPCQACLDAAENRGYEDGLAKGMEP